MILNKLCVIFLVLFLINWNHAKAQLSFLYPVGSVQYAEASGKSSAGIGLVTADFWQTDPFSYRQYHSGSSVFNLSVFSHSSISYYTQEDRDQNGVVDNSISGLSLGDNVLGRLSGDAKRLRFVSSMSGQGIWGASISSIFPTTYLGVSVGASETWTRISFYVPVEMDVAIVGGIKSFTDGSADSIYSYLAADFAIIGDGPGIWRIYEMSGDDSLTIRETIRLLPGNYELKTMHRALGAYMRTLCPVV